MSDDEVVSAALLSPAFASDLSTWRLTINRDGLLRQAIRVSNYENSYLPELRQMTSELPDGELMRIIAFAEGIHFRRFRDKYEHETMVVTDLATLSISVRLADGIKTVEAYGPDEIAAHESNQDMAGFVELWAHIHRFAPYPPETEPTRQLARAFFAVPRDRSPAERWP